MPIHYKTRGHIADIIIDGDGPMNPVTPEMMKELYEAFLRFKEDRTVRVAILTGAGDTAFCVGGNMKRHWATRETFFSPEQLVARFWHPSEHANVAGEPWIWNMCMMEQFKPVIAAVRGFCLGGGLINMLAMSDIRIVSEDAQFGLSEIRLGHGAGVFALTRLHHQLNYAMAMELILTGDRMSAQDALRLGLVNRVVPKERVQAVAEEYAQRVAANSPSAVRASKEVFIRAMDEPSRANLSRLTDAIGVLQRQGKDMLEGHKAWEEKRKPVFTDD
jgi:E-phenylitaconyl-CoA hydratase